MSYDPSDAEYDEFYDAIARELYPEHKAQAINEFTSERLRSFYLGNPMVMRPAVDAIQEGKRLMAESHFAAALVFFAIAVELLLKATVLKPVVYGLVHSESLADVVVEQTLGQTGFNRYIKLLSKLYFEFAEIDIKSVVRSGASEDLLSECAFLQSTRNKIIHQGATCGQVEANSGLQVAIAVFQMIVVPMLGALRLSVGEKGVIQAAQV